VPGVEFWFPLFFVLHISFVVSILLISVFRDSARRRAGVGSGIWFAHLSKAAGGTLTTTGGVGRIAGGTVRGVDVLLVDSKKQVGRRCVRAEGPSLHPLLSLRPEGMLGAADLQADDPDFDRAFKLQGPPHLLVAVLPRATRRKMLMLRERGIAVVLEKGVLELRGGWTSMEGAFLGVIVREAVELMEQLAVQAADIESRLAQVALDPREPLSWRALAVGHLLGRSRSSDEAKRVTLELSGGSSPELDIALARHLGAPPGPLRDRLVDVVQHRRGAQAVQTAALQVLGRAGDPHLRPLFAGVLADATDGPRADAAREALARLTAAIGGSEGGLTLAAEDRQGALTEVAGEGGLAITGARVGKEPAS
jgi:hypothetical protein